MSYDQLDKLFVGPVARKIRPIIEFKGTAALYKLNPPLANYENDSRHYYVIVSAVTAYTGDETFILPADGHGNVIDWGELPGSFQGGKDHKRALIGAGYTVWD